MQPDPTHNKKPAPESPKKRKGKTTPKNDDREENTEPVQREPEQEKLEAFINRVLDTMPPLTQEQRERLALLLRTHH